MPTAAATYTGSDLPTVIMTGANPNLAEANCPRCLWSTRGMRHISYIEIEAAEHDKECTGQPPAHFSAGALELCRSRLVAIGKLDARDWERAATYFRGVRDVTVNVPSAGSRRWCVEFPPLVAGGPDEWARSVVLEITHSRGFGYMAMLLVKEKMGDMTRYSPHDTSRTVQLDTFRPMTKSGRPSPYSARRAAEFGGVVLADLRKAEPGLVRRVPGSLVDVSA